MGRAASFLLFGALVSLGLVLYPQFYVDSLPALLVILAVLGGLGAYLAWFVVVLAFSADRRREEGDELY